MSKRVRMSLVLLAILALASACSKDEEEPLTSPSSAFLTGTTGGVTGSTGISGVTATSGAMPTSPALVLTLVIQSSDGIAAFTSHDGECDITIDVAIVTKIAGSFRCPDVATATGQVVNASGSFQAEA